MGPRANFTQEQSWTYNLKYNFEIKCFSVKGAYFLSTYYFYFIRPILYICLSSMSIFYLINLFNFMLGCGLPTHIKAIFD